MATKSSAAKRKASSASAARTAKPAAKPAANPFKKVGASIAASSTATKPAAAASAADAFGYSKQFSQATDWMRNGAEGFQKLFAQQPSAGLPDFSQFTKGFGTDFSQFTKGFGADASQFTQQADAASRSVQEIVALSTEQFQKLSECGNAAVSIAKDMSQEVAQSASAIFNEQLELSKAMLQCRNIDDVVDLQSKASRVAMDTVFTESVRLTELAFKHAADLAEPFQKSVSSMTERFGKLVAA